MNENAKLENALKQVNLIDVRAELFKKGDFDFIVNGVDEDGNKVSHEKQRLALQILCDNAFEDFLYGGAAGGAKKTDLDTKLLTPTGFKKLRDVKVGERLLNPDGSIQTITHLHPITKDAKYVFKLSNGEEVNSHEEHLWYGGWRRDKSDYLASWDNPYCIKTTKQIYDHVQNEKGKTKKRHFRIPIPQKVEFEQKGEIKLDPYFFGAMIGNGTMTKISDLKLTVFKDDLEHFLNIFHEMGIDVRYHLQTKKSCYDIVIKPKDRERIKSILKGYGILNCKAKTKFVPEEYKITSRKNRLNILRGMLDTDGTMETSTGRVGYFTSSERLAHDVAWISRSLGHFATVVKRDGRDNYRKKEDRTIYGSDCYTVYIRSKNNKDLFKVKRKTENCKDDTKDYMSVAVLDVEIQEPVEMRCITVSNPNGLYIIDNFIVTHNTWTACCWLLFMCINYPETRYFVARNELGDIVDSVLVTWGKVCREYGFTDYKFNGVKNFIQLGNGSHINFIELKYKPSDPDYNDVGSTEYTCGFIEECSEITEKGVDVISSRVGRHLNKKYGIRGKVFMTTNPRKNWTKTRYHDRAKNNTLPKESAYLQCLVTENPFIERDYVEKMRKMATKDKALYERLFMGNWDYSENPDALCDYEMIEQVFGNDHVIEGKTYITADIARMGSDKAVILVWRGWKVVDIQTYDLSKTTEQSYAINLFRRKYQVPKSRVVVDSDGIGGSVVDQTGAVAFVNNATPIKEDGDKPTYRNLQVQCLYHLADKINEGGIWINCELTNKQKEEIKEELDQIQKKLTDYGKLDCKPKSDIKQDIGRSPDYRDALMMRMYFDLKPPRRKMAISSPGW